MSIERDCDHLLLLIPEVLEAFRMGFAAVYWPKVSHFRVRQCLNAFNGTSHFV